MSETFEPTPLAEDSPDHTVEPQMKTWVQINFCMKSENEITTAWEETDIPLEEFNPFVLRTPDGTCVDMEPAPGQFVGFGDPDDGQTMVYVQITEVEAFAVTMIQAAERPE